MIKKSIYLILCFTVVVLLADACSNHGKKPETSKEAVKADTSREEECTKTPSGTIKDPNHPKPMALMMRQMVNYGDSMKAQLLRDEKLDAKLYPFLRFYFAEPTDPEVLEPKFYDNARLFQAAWKEIFSHPREQKKYYNAMIGKCINCHESYCSGPLKRIRKLVIIY